MIAAVRVPPDRPFNVNLFCQRAPARNPRSNWVWLSRLTLGVGSGGAEKNAIDAQNPINAAFLGPFGYLRLDQETSLAETEGD